MTETVWRGNTMPLAKLADELAATEAHVIRLPDVEPIQVVSLTMSAANRDLIVEALRASVGRDQGPA